MSTCVLLFFCRTGTNSLESARRRDELLSRPLPPSSSSCAAKSSAAAPQTLGGSGGGGGPSWNGSSGPSSDSSSSVCSSGSGGTTTATSAALEISCGASTSSSASADKGGTGFHVKVSLVLHPRLHALLHRVDSWFRGNEEILVVYMSLPSLRLVPPLPCNSSQSASIAQQDSRRNRALVLSSSSPSVAFFPSAFSSVVLFGPTWIPVCT